MAHFPPSLSWLITLGSCIHNALPSFKMFSHQELPYTFDRAFQKTHSFIVCSVFWWLNIVWVHVWACVWDMCACMSLCVQAYACEHVHRHMRVFTCMYAYVCLRVYWKKLCVCVCLCLSLSLCMNINTITIKGSRFTLAFLDRHWFKSQNTHLIHDLVSITLSFFGFKMGIIWPLEELEKAETYRKGLAHTRAIVLAGCYVNCLLNILSFPSHFL